MKTRHPHLVAAALLAGAAVALAAPAQGPPASRRPDHQSGAYLYRAFCASCHGDGGAGDGAVADLLKRPPSDLTRLARRAGGVFPREAAIRTIDGRTAVAAHGTREMPVWGDRLQITEGQNERIIRQRLEAIASHLESIQAK